MREPEFLTTSQLLELLQIGRTKLWELVKNGAFPAISHRRWRERALAVSAARDPALARAMPGRGAGGEHAISGPEPQGVYFFLNRASSVAFGSPADGLPAATPEPGAK